MRIQTGFEITYDCPAPVPMLLMLSVVMILILVPAWLSFGGL